MTIIFVYVFILVIYVYCILRFIYNIKYEIYMKFYFFNKEVLIILYKLYYRNIVIKLKKLIIII